MVFSKRRMTNPECPAPTKLEQIEALHLSAEHWLKDNVNAKKPEDMDFSSGSCACCVKWLYGPSRTECTHCPIAIHTSRRLCRGTPYANVVNLNIIYHLMPSPSNRAAFQAAVALEYAFLITLAHELTETL